LSELRLDGLDRRISRWDTIINGLRIIVRLTIRVVIVWVVVVSVIRQVIPWKESVIEPEPEAVVKNEEPIVEEVGMPPVPAVVPISVMAFSDVVRPPVQSAL